MFPSVTAGCQNDPLMSDWIAGASVRPGARPQRGRPCLLRGGARQDDGGSSGQRQGEDTGHAESSTGDQ